MRFEKRANDEEENSHSHGRDEQRHLATERVDKEEDEERGRHTLHNTIDTGGQK